MYYLYIICHDIYYYHDYKFQSICICQYLPVNASICRYLPVNATGMENTSICRHFANKIIEDEVLIHVEGKQARTGKQKSFQRKYTNASASCGRLHRLVPHTDNLTAKLSTGCSALDLKIYRK